MSSYDNSPAAFGLFKAEVINTDKFLKTGYINVFIDGVDFEQTNTADTIRNCIVLTQYGGLDKMGLITCPPIGSIGYVMFPNGNLNNDAIWMGNATVPSDQNVDKDDNSKQKLPQEMKDPTDILLKTQYTTQKDQTLNKSSNKVENYLKLNEESITIAKVRQDDYENFDYSRDTITDQPVNSIQIKNDSILVTLSEKGNKYFNTILLNDAGITLSFDNGDKTSYIKLHSGGISLNAADKSTISVGVDGIISVEGDQEVDLNGTSDNVTKWSGFNDFVDVYNNHCHGSPDGPTSDTNSKWTKSTSAKADKVKCN